MDPVGPSGEFIIDYSVFDAIRAGFNKVIFIIRRDIEKDFKKSIGKRISEKIEVAYTFQELADLPEGTQYDPKRTKPWGTVQAALTCAGAVNDPFAVVNADDFYGSDAYSTLSKYLDSMTSDNVNACMVGFRLDRTLSDHGSVTRGICQCKDNDILDSVVETQGVYKEDGRICYKDAAGNINTLKNDELASMNFWGFVPSILDLFRDEFNLFLQEHSMEPKSELVIPTTVNSLVNQGKAAVKVLSTTSNWFGITNPQDRDDVIGKIRKLIDSGQYPDNLWK